MAEIALVLALGALGFSLANNDPYKEDFSVQPRPTEQHTDEVTHSQVTKGHNNEVPFFGPRVTQAMYSGGTDHILDSKTGAGKEYFQKRETFSMFDIKAGTGNPFGQQDLPIGCVR